MCMRCVHTCCTAARLRCCCCSAAVCSMRCCCWAAYICCRYWAAAVLGCLFKACWMTWVRWDEMGLLNEHEYCSAHSLLSPLGDILIMVCFITQKRKEKHFVCIMCNQHIMFYAERRSEWFCKHRGSLGVLIWHVGSLPSITAAWEHDYIPFTAKVYPT